MKLNVPTSSLPFSTIQLLNKFEKQLSDEILRLLNESYQHIKVDVPITLDQWQGAPVVITDNASLLVPGSRELVRQVTEYVSTKDEIEDILKGFTLNITLRMTKREPMPKNENQPQPQRKEELPVFTPIEPRYRFDQMILSDHVKQELDDAMKIVRHKDLIYNVWGFGEVDPVPRSILNFYGEPGTGKTMCAHAIAHSLGKQLLALNYSEIESKFVGEAAKNLQHAFETAKESDAVLFFDEADSFLGKRIENVTQGAEQALNSLRSQMLIQLEQFPGVVLFATNLVTNFDHAFESRILKHIQFELPNQEARVAIIRKMLPSKLPMEPLTDDQLMEASALIEGFSGREIKSAILELLLCKAGTESPTFTFEDLCNVFTKKYQEKKELARQEEERLKKKIEKKLKEKAAENQALEAQKNAEAETEDTTAHTTEGDELK